MNDRELEKIIENVVNKNTPDDFEAILEACHIDKEEIDHHHDKVVPFGTEAKKKNRMYRNFMGIAAAFIICIAGVMFMNGASSQVAAIVGIDVNPSIELSVNKGGKVLDAQPVNKDGEVILEEMELKGSDVNVAANAIIGSMLKHGYLNDISNSIIVSVQSDDQEVGSRMEEEISKNLNEYLESCAIGGAILGQYVSSNDDIAAFASENGISTGKAALIKALVACDSGLTEKSLLKASTNELLLIADDRKDLAGRSMTYGKVNSSEYISKDKALDIVLEKAGMKREDIDDYDIEFECDEGQMMYDVTVRCGALQFEADIDASVGTIVEFDKEGEDITTKEAGGYIGYDEAKRIALNKAGVNESDITDFEVEIDDGQYEMEFDYKHMEYEIEIDAKTGTVVHFHKEYDAD